MKRVGIVGHEAAKFTPETEARARAIIRSLISPECVVVSGRCHLGGIDVWAEEEAAKIGARTLIFPPKTHMWGTGYKPRNLQIAGNSDEVHCLCPFLAGSRRMSGGHRAPIRDFSTVKAGDVVTRLLAGKVPMKLKVTKVTDTLIICATPLGTDAWTFDRKTGVEEDAGLGWGVKFGVTGSYLIE